MRSLAAIVWLAASTAHAQSALEVEGYAPASFVEANAGRRPVIVALHGNFDRPEWMCAAWARVVRGRAFLLCPRGLPRRDAPGYDRWTHRQPRALVAEIAAARAALSARFPNRVDDGPAVLVGFSLGAHRTADLASRDPARYPRVQLVEGGDLMLANEGGRFPGRIAITCAQIGCERRARRLVAHLSDRARMEHIPTCHACLDDLMPAIMRTFDWLVEDDPRFAD